MIFPPLVWLQTILMSTYGKLDPENIGLAIGLSSKSSLGAEIHAFDVLSPPSWILHFRLIHTVFPSIPMESRTQNLGNTVGLPLMSRL